MYGVISGERFTPQELLFERAARAASGLAAAGLERGDAVAIVMRNDIPFLEASYACTALGVYAVPVNWHWQVDEVRYLLEDSGAKVVVAHADLMPVVRAALPEGVLLLGVATPPEVAAVYNIAPERCDVPADVPEWGAWLSGFPVWDQPPARAVGTMVYTSGTTGRPKGVRRQPADPSLIPELMRLFGLMSGLHDGARTVVPAPMYHSAPNGYAIQAARMKALVVLQPRFDAEELLALVEKHRITHLQLVPTMMIRLLRVAREAREKYDVSSLEYVVHAAAPCPIDVKRKMIEWLGPIVYEYYGCTESGMFTTCTSEEWLSHPGTVGRPVDGAVVKILDENGNEQPPGVPGDVYGRLECMADFTYHGQDDERRAIERDGLLTCGDMGYLDEDGYLYLCDRRKDMVISGGVNIYPAEIEQVLIALDGVRDCAVFGIPDEEFGEALAAYIEPEPGATLDADAVRTFLRERMAGYKVPRVVEFRDELPREDSGKIFKRLLREPYWSQAGRSI
ncbi:MAG TPA: acyl-CoA synthetase [Acidimicrobiales bacterium]|nr:acyl-CoA synthetase [Acidimicrobiales bacterium]